MLFKHKAFATGAFATALLLAARDAAAQPGGFSAQPGGGPGAPPPPTPAAPEQRPPRLARFIEATYPPEALRQGRDAQVLLELEVDAAGHVTAARVVQGAGDGFDEAAVEAARRFEFDAARRNGQAIAAVLRYRYRFNARAAAAAQQPRGPAAVVEGVVLDAANHPVAGATVELQAGAAAAQTFQSDAQGAFRFELTEAGSVSLRVTREGFREFRSQEVATRGERVTLRYRLVPEAPAAPANGAASNGTAARPPTPARGAGNEDEVVVRASRPIREVTRTTLELREINRIPGTGGDALRAIQNLPGMARPPFASGLLIVRGAAPQDTEVLVDGTSIPLLYHFGGLTSVIQTEMLDRIDFYPGNFSARFGRAMGGVIDVGLRSPRQNRWRGVVNISVIDASAFVEGPITRNLTISLALRRSYIDAFLGAILQNVPGVNVTAAPVYYDYQGVLEWRATPRDRFRLAVFGTDDQLSILFQRPGNQSPSLAGGVSTATRFHLAQLSWQHDFAPGTSSRLMFSGGWTGASINAFDIAQLNLSFVPLNLRYEFSHQVIPQLRANVGLDVQFGSGSFSVSLPRVDSSNPDPATAPRITSSSTLPVFTPALYAELEATPVPGLRLVPGVRVDWFQDIRQATVSPRLSGRYEFNRWFALKAGVGLFTQNPQLQESTNAQNNLFPGRTLGNPNLGASRAMHYSFGFDATFSPWISLSMEGFYKTLDDLVYSTPTSAQLGQNPPPPYLNSGIGRIYGAEVLLRHRPSSRFFGWIAYTLMRSERRPTPTSDWIPYQYDQTHILTLVGSVNVGAGFEIGARFRYVTGSPTTPIVGAIYNTNSMTYQSIPGPTNSARNRDFNQLDVRVDKTFRFRWGSFGIFLEVLNVYNYTNQEGTIYNYNYTQSQPLSGLPIIPNLGIRGEVN